VQPPTGDTDRRADIAVIRVTGVIMTRMTTMTKHRPSNQEHKGMVNPDNKRPETLWKSLRAKQKE